MITFDDDEGGVAEVGRGVAGRTVGMPPLGFVTPIVGSLVLLNVTSVVLSDGCAVVGANVTIVVGPAGVGTSDDIVTGPLTNDGAAGIAVTPVGAGTGDATPVVTVVSVKVTFMEPVPVLVDVGAMVVPLNGPH